MGKDNMNLIDHMDSLLLMGQCLMDLMYPIIFLMDPMVHMDLVALMDQCPKDHMDSVALMDQ